MLQYAYYEVYQLTNKLSEYLDTFIAGCQDHCCAVFGEISLCKLYK